MRDTVASFRKFNRFYTRVLGLFRPRLLDSPLALAEARVLFEIRADPGVSAADIGRMLCMDRAQVSRILSKLVKLGLARRPGEHGGRRGLPLHPTKKGRDLLARLDKAADAQARELLGGLDRGGRERLGSALDEVQSLLGGAQESGEAEIRPARPGDMGWVISCHAEVYGREWGFDADFERYVLQGMAVYAAQDSDTRSGLWIAEQGGRRVGAIAAVDAGDDRAQLRWFIVLPEARRSGVGTRLLARALDHCREQDFESIFLWTLADLHPARRLYESRGFSLAETKPGIMGGLPMDEERWKLDLA